MDETLRSILRELLEEGRQLSVTRGPEDGIVNRYAARINAHLNPPKPAPTKFKRGTRAKR